jgi:hypothetical protein
VIREMVACANERGASRSLSECFGEFMRELRRGYVEAPKSLCQSFEVFMGGSEYVSFLQSLLSPNFLDYVLMVKIRLQRRPLRFSGIDSSSPLLRSRAK